MLLEGELLMLVAIRLLDDVFVCAHGRLLVNILSCQTFVNLMCPKRCDDDNDMLLLQADTRNQGWWFWPEPIRKREPAALAAAIQLHKDDIERFIALQFLFDRQWKAVKVQLVHLCCHAGPDTRQSQLAT